MKSAILYSRFSSAAQGKEGRDSVRRQSTNGKAYADKLGLRLVEVTDKGVSAFKAKNNANTGKLADLIKSAESGKIPKGTILIVESLDRVSRQTPLDALAIFQRLLKAGLEIHTLTDNQIYTAESVQDNFYQLLGSLFVMSRAHEESKTKSGRIKESIASRKRKTALQGEVWHGSRPSWIDLIDGKPVLNDRAKIMQRIFQMALSGDGDAKICLTLNKEGIPSARKDKQWDTTSLRKMMNNPAVYGSLVIDYNAETDATKPARMETKEIKGYYPALISFDDFNRLKSIKAKKAPVTGRRSKNDFNVFAGLLKCGCCGQSMQLHQLKKKDKHYYSFKCASKTKNPCANPNVGFDKFKKLFFDVLENIDYSALHEATHDREVNTLNQKLESIQGELITVKQGITSNMKVMELSANPEIFASRIDDLLTKQKELEIESKQLQIKIDSIKSPVETKPINIKKDLSNQDVAKVLQSQIKEIRITNLKMKSDKKLFNAPYEHFIDIDFHSGKWLESHVDFSGDISFLDTRTRN